MRKPARRPYRWFHCMIPPLVVVWVALGAVVLAAAEDEQTAAETPRRAESKPAGTEGDDQPAPPALPAGLDVKALVTEAVLAYGEADRSGDLGSYHKSLSSEFRAEVTPETLRERAGALKAGAEEVAAVADLEPVFDTAPAADGQGGVAVAGRYPTKPRAVSFALRFVKERGGWKVRDISVEFAKREKAAASTRPTTRPAAPEGPVVPADGLLKELIAKTLLEWNACVTSGDFQPLYDNAAAPFREQITPRRLHVTFQRFVEQGVDIGGIRHVEPVIEKGPAINGGRVLSVVGHYPTKPEHVAFELRHLYEDGKWKLLAIHVKFVTPPKTKEKAKPPAAKEPGPARGGPPSRPR